MVKTDMRSLTTSIRTIPLEAGIWLIGLSILVVAGPWLEGRVTLCVPSLLGLDMCPGCGLGASIAALSRGDISASWAAHPLGAPAVLVLIARVVSLLKRRSRSIQSS